MQVVILLILILFVAAHTAEKKLEVESVSIEGNNTYNDERLFKIMVTRPSSFLNSVKYQSDMLNEDLKSIEIFYYNRGFLEAKVVSHEVRKDTKEGKAYVHITLHEGERTYIESISIFDNHFFSDSVLFEKISVKDGDPLLRNEIDASTARIIRLYADNGFLNANIRTDIRTKEETHTALVDFLIDEGKQYHINKIKIQGLEKTKPYVVRRELELKKGDVVNYSKLLEAQRRIYLTGLFQSVYVRPDSISDRDSLRNIIIELKEIKPAEFSISAGYATIEKIRGRLEIYTNNFRGTARKLGLQTQASFINRLVQASFTNPWTFGYRWNTDVNISWEYMNQPSYELRKWGGDISFGRNFSRQSSFVITYKMEKVNIFNAKTQQLPDNLRNDVRSLSSALIYDTRDNLFNTTHGYFGQLTTEVSGAFLKSTIGYYRATFDNRYFYPLKASTILGTAVTVGWMDAKGGISGIPLNERFFAGGPNSVRGFNYQRLGSLDESGIPIGGRFKLVWNVLELRQQIYKFIGGVLFLDAGNVWTAPYQFKMKKMRPAAGFGLRLSTPIGLVRGDLGFNLDPQPDEPRYKFYLSMGQAF